MSMQKFIEIEKEKLLKAKFTNDKEMRAIIDKHIESLDLLLRNYGSPEYSEAEAHELTLVTQLLHHNEVPDGTPFSTNDIQFEIAKAFLKKYPLGSVEWGVDMEYEETVYAFGMKYCLDNNIRL